MGEVRAREWRWVGGCAAATLLVVALPYALALIRPPEGLLLARTLYYGNDLSQYLGAMGDGRASGSWLIQDHLTAEPHAPALMYPFYVLLAKIAGLLGLESTTVFVSAVAVSTPVLVFAAYRFAASFCLSVRSRRTALLFVLFASGLGIWVAAATAAGQSGTGGQAFDRAEVSTFLLPFGPPHLPLALAMLLLWGSSLVEWEARGGSGRLPAVLGTTIAIWLLNPFTLAPMVALATCYGVVRWVSTARFQIRPAGAALLVAAVSTPLLAISMDTFGLDPFWSSVYGRQNSTGSPSLAALALDFGVLLPLAIVGAMKGTGNSERGTGRSEQGAARYVRFLVVWVGTLLVLMYLPVPYQRRFGFGLEPALAVLAALGLERAEEMVRGFRGSHLWRSLMRAAISSLAFSGTALSLAILVMAGRGIGGLGEAIFEPAGNVEAAQWLAANTTQGDVVLAAKETGNYLAGRIRGRVVLGHEAGTLDPERKEALVRAFFLASTTSGDRSRIVAEAKAGYVVLGPRERALGGQPLRAEDGFRSVYDGNGVVVYLVERALASIGPRPSP